MKQDFTEGSIYRKLYLFSLPILLTNLLQASMQVINSLWVGNLLGSTAFGAVTIGTTVMTVVLAFVLGINNATLTIFAQLKGKDDQNEIKSYLSSFVILLIALSLAVGGFGYIFAKPLLALLNTPDSIIPIAKRYLQINFIGTLFLVGYNFIGTVLRAFGDSRTPLYFVLLATVLNAGFDPLFIAGFGMGVAGAAYATVLAQTLAFLYSLFYLGRRFKHHSFKFQVPKWVEIKTILRLGIPSGIQMIVIYAGMTVILSVVNTFGESTVAGFGAAQRLDSIILLPAIALGTAVNAMAGQNIGANKWQRVSLISKAGVLYNTGVMLAIAVILFIWAEPLVKLFLKDQESVAFGTVYLRTIAFFYPFIGLNFIFNGIVRGAGAMFHVLILNIISLWILRVPLTYVAASLYGEIGIALGIGISFLISCLFSVGYYRWGSWRKKQLFE
ncbi:MATE family efflux transporter [Neobacillus notoginsengisoli]|uniref:Probable multidrug resistance protein NorM n=1 Tax=Neobacillus notoginsengisoli TaxID=1578198 RepID=A0A417Z0D8_9BACI|nr:MATE family efflux transporter [Neobacillus notoginsengisoli]RHW43619.1 MATE family efflux transporter [Neobacillus notoginsengisoli]